LSEKARHSPIISEVVTVDDKLAVKIPESVCRTLEITPGTKLLLTAARACVCRYRVLGLCNGEG